MWLRLLFDTNATLQGDGDAFCIAGVAFFRGVMHLGRSVMQWGEACFTWGSDAFIVHEMGQGSVAFGIHDKLFSPVTQGLSIEESYAKVRPATSLCPSHDNLIYIMGAF